MGKTPTKEADYRLATFHDSRLPDSARLVGVALAYRCWRRWELYASHATVAKWAGISASTAKRAVSALEDHGYLTRRGYGQNGTVRYGLVLPGDTPPEPGDVLTPEDEAEIARQAASEPEPIPVGARDHGVACDCLDCGPPF